jgi:ABC-2 type transport system ATP-binding protein
MIEIVNLTQTYKSGKGVFNLNFTINDGEVFGYLGPNGAGKTTTIRNILGFMNASEGKVLINGLNSRTETPEINKIIGFLPGEIAFYNQLKGKDFLDLLAQMRGLTDFTLRKRLEHMFKLETNVYIKKMSKGMKQKLAIIAAFMHDPKILILDEPTSGLDPLMQNIFLDLILEEKNKGKTILLSSHIFEEVEKICDRAGIIKDGYLLAVEDIKSLRSKYEDVFQITISNNYREFFKELQNFKVIKIESIKQSIEDIFMKYYGDDQNE